MGRERERSLTKLDRRLDGVKRCRNKSKKKRRINEMIGRKGRVQRKRRESRRKTGKDGRNKECSGRFLSYVVYDGSTAASQLKRGSNNTNSCTRTQEREERRARALIELESFSCLHFSTLPYTRHILHCKLTLCIYARLFLFPKDKWQGLEEDSSTPDLFKWI